MAGATGITTISTGLRLWLVLLRADLHFLPADLLLPGSVPRCLLYGGSRWIPGPVVSTAPSVIQQTTVAVVAPVAPAVNQPICLLKGARPVAVQKTKVGAGVP